MSKVISCGIVILNKSNEILGCKASYRKDGRYDIPKGKMEIGETNIETAIRELREETGLVVKPEDLIDCGLHEYTKSKNLYLYKYNTEVDLDKLKCNVFQDISGKKLIEMESYALIKVSDVNSRFYKPLIPILQKIIKNC